MLRWLPSLGRHCSRSVFAYQLILTFPPLSYSPSGSFTSQIACLTRFDRQIQVQHRVTSFADVTGTLSLPRLSSVRSLLVGFVPALKCRCSAMGSIFSLS